MRERYSDLDKCPLRGTTASAALATFVVLLAGFVQLSLARTLSQTTFRSPEDAGSALFAAVQKHDERAVVRILGAQAKLVSSGDQVQDSLERERFVQKYQEMHRLVQEPGGATILYIGAENWPFPIPLVSRGGMWRFDSDDGANEIRFRRVGENEVTAIGICHALVTGATHPGANSEVDDLVKTVLPDVRHANKPVLFHGYYFRVLSKSGAGFVAVAYPALYRSSGVLTFVVNQDDVVHEKDLGRNTTTVARAMTTYHPDSTWILAEPMF